MVIVQPAPEGPAAVMAFSAVDPSPIDGSSAVDLSPVDGSSVVDPVTPDAPVS